MSVTNLFLSDTICVGEVVDFISFFVLSEEFTFNKNLNCVCVWGVCNYRRRFIRILKRYLQDLFVFRTSTFVIV